MRQLLRAARRVAAARRIYKCLRRHMAKERVQRLRLKHERAAMAVEVLSEMRTKRSGGGWGWSGMSLPENMHKIGRAASSTRLADGIDHHALLTDEALLEAEALADLVRRKLFPPSLLHETDAQRPPERGGAGTRRELFPPSATQS